MGKKGRRNCNHQMVTLWHLKYEAEGLMSAVMINNGLMMITVSIYIGAKV